MERYQTADYTQKSNEELQSLWDYWNGVRRAAKSDAQRCRAEKRLIDVGAEMKRRGMVASSEEARARAGFTS